MIQIVDASGNSVASYEYDPYGKVISATGTLAEVNPIRYRGYYYDNETGLYYLQSRYYDPAIGRFVCSDGYASTVQGFIGYNMYAYCGNSPISNQDLSGCRYIAATTVGGETSEERSIACQYQNAISQSKNNAKQDGISKRKTAINIGKTIINNMEFSFGIGQGLAFGLEVAGVGIDIGAYGNYGSWSYDHGKFTAGQELYAGITTSQFLNEVGVAYHEFREYGESEYQDLSWAWINTDQSSISIVGGSFYVLFAGFSFNIGFDPAGFLIDYEALS